MMPLQTYLQFHIDRIQSCLEAGSPDLFLSYGSEVIDPTPEQRARRFKELIENTLLRLGQLIDDPNGDVKVFVPWIPETTVARVQQHFTRLQIPTLNRKPSLLLHGLGDPNAFDLALPGCASPSRPSRAKILRSIFPAGPSPFDIKHSVLFNTSGAGKTRLVLQGLCEKWGFYLTCSRQASQCGSADIETVLQPSFGHLKTCGLEEHPSSPFEFQTNEEIAERCFTAILTARFLVFLCLLAAFEVRFGVPTGSQIPFLKKLWMLVQLDTRLLEQAGHRDIFSELTTLLCHTKKHSTLAPDYVRLFNICKNFLGPNSHVYCVLDEAHIAANSYQGAFISSDGNEERPTLRAMLKIWSDFGLRHVITGTSSTLESLEYINDALSSAVSKRATVLNQAVTDTGSFVEQADQIEGFLRYYLPSWLLDTESGKELVERAKYWLCGRPRFITAYVTCLIENNLQCPHQVLTKYIKAVTNFVPADAEFWEKLENTNEPSEEPKDSLNEQFTIALQPFDLTRAMNFSNILLRSVQQLVYHRLLSGRTDFETSGEGLVSIDLVECGFARYPSAARGRAAFDEPLAYLAADHWITSRTKSKHQYFVQRIDKSATDSNGFGRYTAMCLAHVFKEFTPLSSVFDFAKVQANRKLANEKARLVSCWINANEMFMVAPTVYPLILNENGGGPVDHMSSPSNILGYTSMNPKDDISWLEFRINAPFLFPQTNLGPDLMFRLQLEGGKLLTVALNTEYKQYASAITTPDAIQKAVNSVNPDKFYRNINGKAYASESYDDLPKKTLDALDSLPQRYSADDVGYHSVLCGLFVCPTVAPGKPEGWQAYREILEKIDDAKVTVNLDHEFFIVKFDAIQELTREMSPYRALDRLVAGLRARWLAEAQEREETEGKKPGKKGKKTNAGDIKTGP